MPKPKLDNQLSLSSPQVAEIFAIAAQQQSQDLSTGQKAGKDCKKKVS